MTPPPRDSAYFDRWYADMAASPVKDAILRRHLGYPESLGPAGVLPWAALDELEARLAVPAGGLLVDVACGRGGYGVELAARRPARLVGVDFSVVALAQARRVAEGRLPGGAAFVAGTLTGTALPDAVADGVLCTDSVQFAEPPRAALLEFRRVLVSGGRVALTTWQPATPGDPAVAPRLRDLDLRRDLVAAGFGDVVVEERPRWREAERAAFAEAVAIGDASKDDDDDHGVGDAALASFQAEGRRALENWDGLVRVLASATAP